MLTSLATGMLSLFVMVGGETPSTTNDFSVDNVATERSALSAGVMSCDEVCMGMTDGGGNHITNFCVTVGSPYGDGTGCSASVSDCTFTDTEGCGNATFDDLNDFALLLSDADGRLVSVAALCEKDGRVIGLRHVDFLTTRQRTALAESSRVLRSSIGN